MNLVCEFLAIDADSSSTRPRWVAYEGVMGGGEVVARGGCVLYEQESKRQSIMTTPTRLNHKVRNNSMKLVFMSIVISIRTCWRCTAQHTNALHHHTTASLGTPE